MITLTAKITLADGTEIPIKKKNALSIDESIIDRGDIILPSWGIISNGGSISFMDYDGNIKELAQSLKLTSQTKVNIYLNNTFLNQPINVGEFFADRWNYDNNSSEVRATFNDGLTQMQNIIIIPLEYSLQREDSTTNTAREIYDTLRSQTIANGFDMISTSDSGFDNTTLQHLEKISIAYPYLEETNLWRAWQYFAEAFQLHIYKDRQGIIVCKYNGGD